MLACARSVAHFFPGFLPPFFLNAKVATAPPRRQTAVRMTTAIGTLKSFSDAAGVEDALKNDRPRVVWVRSERAMME